MAALPSAKADGAAAWSCTCSAALTLPSRTTSTVAALLDHPAQNLHGLWDQIAGREVNRAAIAEEGGALLRKGVPSAGLTRTDF
jgi:hypothetical protein